MRVALQMDALESINPASDTTLLLGIEALRRGYEVFHYPPEKLSMQGASITASARRVSLFADPAKYYEYGEELTLDLSEVDVVLLRQDPPFNMAYLTTTYILERLPPSVRVVNDPGSVRNHPEKLFPLLLERYMPPTLISADPAQIARFRAEHKDIILKPLYGFGGHSILRLKEDDENFQPLLEMQFAASREPLVVQAFLPEVRESERRIVLIGGEVAGVMGRIPAAGEIRSNLRVGGKAVAAELTPKQRKICAELGPMLRRRGLLLAGLDVIGDWLTEINITSPTGLAPLNKLYGARLESDVWDAIEHLPISLEGAGRPEKSY